MYGCTFRPFLFGDDSSVTHSPEQGTEVVQVCTQLATVKSSTVPDTTSVPELLKMGVIQQSLLTAWCHWQEFWEGRSIKLLHLTDLVVRKACRHTQLPENSHRYELYILHLLAPPRVRNNVRGVISMWFTRTFGMTASHTQQVEHLPTSNLVWALCEIC